MKAGVEMKISTRGRYGLRALVDIASQADNNKCVTLKSIAERQGISENYLEHLIVALKKAKYVRSVRGAQGGYILNVAPEDVSVRDILAVLEGSLSVVDCVDGMASDGCGLENCKTCVTKNVWYLLQEKIDEVLNNIKLVDLVQDYKLLTVIEKDDYF